MAILKRLRDYVVADNDITIATTLQRNRRNAVIGYQFFPIW